MKFPETHLGHSYGASVPSSEEMGLFKDKKTPSQQVMSPKQFSNSDLWTQGVKGAFYAIAEVPLSFARAYAQYYHETSSGSLIAKNKQLEDKITELQKTEFDEI